MLEELEDENRRLKKAYTEKRLKAELRKEALERKPVEPSQRKEIVRRAVNKH